MPKRVQDAIPIQTVYLDGIFKVGRSKYAKTYKFTDINYEVASHEDKKGMFWNYSDILNSLDSGATVKLTVAVRKMNKEEFKEKILMTYQGDELDRFRKEVNQMLLDKTQDANGLMKELYVTVSVYKKGIEEARNYFLRMGIILRISEAPVWKWKRRKNCVFCMIFTAQGKKAASSSI